MLLVLCLMFPLLSQAVTYQNYQADIINKITVHKDNIILHFYASWCPTCKKQKSVIEPLIKPIKDDLTVVLVNFDDADDVKKIFNVKTQGIIIAFKDGKEADRLMSVTDKEEIKAFIDKEIKK